MFRDRLSGAPRLSQRTAGAGLAVAAATLALVLGTQVRLAAVSSSSGGESPPAGVGAAPAGPVVDAAPFVGRYVSVHGSDRSDGSFDSPWRTLGHALQQLRAGDRLYVRAGTYREDLDPVLAKGTAASRITVSNYREERAVVAGLVRFSDPDYWTIRGLEFTWDGGDYDDHMVKVSAGTGWIVEGVRIHGSRSRAGLLIAGSEADGPPRDYVLRHSAVYDSARASNLYLNPGLDSTGGLIEHNLFFNSPTENIKVGYGGSCQDQRNGLYGAANVVVRHNTLYNGWQPLTIAEPARHIEVYGNIVARSGRESLLRLDGVCHNLGRGIRVHDNLGFGAEKWCEEFSSPVTCRDVDGGGTVFPRAPDFDATDVGGFHPRDRVARGYGRYAEVRR